MKFVDMFCGMGTIRMGFEQAGHECVYSVEWDKHKRKIYEVVFGHEPEGCDITTVRAADIPPADCWCFGAPCQDFSVAGLRAGLDGERSGLVREVFRLVGEKEPDDRPEWLLYENVKGMLSSNLGWDFAAIQAEMGELGYDVQWQLLNSKNFGVPQNRERVYTLGHLRARGGREIFPLGEGDSEADELYRQRIIANTVTARTGRAYGVGIYVYENQREAQIKQIGNIKPTATRDNPNQGRVYDADGIAPCLNKGEGGGLTPMIVEPRPCLTPDRPEKRQNGRRFKEPEEPMFTLAKQDVRGVLMTQKRITRVTDNAGTLTARNPSTSCGNNTPITGVLVKEATSTGYAEANVGDSINFSMPNSKTRRGKVGKGVANTLDCACNQGVLVDDDDIWEKYEQEDCAERNNLDEGLQQDNETYATKILLELRKAVGEEAFAKWGLAILDAFQQAEVLQSNVYEETLDDDENEVTKDATWFKGKCSQIFGNVFRELLMPDMREIRKNRYASQGREPNEQRSGELDDIVQKLSYEIASPEIFMQDLWKAGEGVRILREALSKIQKIWKPICGKNQSTLQYRIRRLSPRECFRLQGIPDDITDKLIAAGISDTQVYRAAGDACTVNVIYEIARRL